VDGSETVLRNVEEQVKPVLADSVKQPHRQKGEPWQEERHYCVPITTVLSTNSPKAGTGSSRNGVTVDANIGEKLMLQWVRPGRIASRV
jgi:hypothetical protein